ncbi:MAG TPA: GAF domain-containing protein, partial [Patescibacteria group bacterium]|nr:GAF domain-containing protein [Patescibacteria group bacterium]
MSTTESRQRSTIDILKKGQQRLRKHLLAGDSLEEILTSLVITAEELSPGLHGAVFLIRPGTNLLFKVVAPNIPDNFFKTMQDGIPVSGDAAPKGIEKFFKDKVLNPDIVNDPFYSLVNDNIRENNFHSCWTHPIHSSGNAIGTFTVYHTEARNPTIEELDLMEIITGLAGMAIEMKESEESLKINIAEQKNREEMLYFLNKASEQLATTLDYSVAYEEISHLIVPRLADWFTVEVVSESGTLDLLIAAHKDPERLNYGLELRKKYPPDLHAETGTARVLRTGKSELYPRVTEEMLRASARDDQYFDLVSRAGFYSVMIVP